MMIRTGIGIVTLIAAFLCVPRLVAAQGVTVGGEIGTHGELYAVGGAERRRPPATGRLYLRPTFSLYGRFTLSLDFMLSTEGNTFQSARRQSLNQYGINPQWGWGSANLGDFTDTYTPLTFSGVRVRGAGVDVRRGPLRVGTFGGRTQRAVLGGATTGRFERNIVGGRIAIGDPRRSSLGLIVLRVRDDVTSLASPEDTALIDLEPDTVFVEDTLQVGAPTNLFAVTPQENLVMGLVGTLGLFQDGLSLRGELVGSGYTRDLRADVIESEEILTEVPGVARALFTPRVGSTADYAYTLEATGRAAPLTVTARYRNIGPGYVSLGVASLLSDQRDVRLTTALRFRRWNVKLDGARQRDNLIGQKTFTTNRTRMGVAVAFRPTRVWSANVRANYISLDNNALDEPERWVAYASWILGTNQTLKISRRGTLRSASLGYTYRTSGDENPMRTQSASRSHTVNLRTLVSITRNVNLAPSVGIVRSRFGGGPWTTRQTYTLAAQLRLMRGKWASSLGLGRSQVNQTTSLRATLTSRYQLTRRDAVTLAARASDNDNALESGQDFRELLVSVRWAHRF